MHDRLRYGLALHVLTAAEAGEAGRILAGMAAIGAVAALLMVVPSGRRGSAFRSWCHGSLLFPVAVPQAGLRRS